MRILRFRHIALAFAVMMTFLLTGCGKIREVRVGDYNVDSVSLDGRRVEAVISVTVDNPAKQIRISDVKGTIYLEDREMAVFEAEPVILEGKSEGKYPLECGFALADGLSIMKFMALAASSDMDAVTADLEARVKVKGGIKKKIRFRNVPLKELIKRK